MNTRLKQILEIIGKDFSHHLSKTSWNYMEVDIGKRAHSLGYDDLGKAYRDVFAVIPLKAPVPGMKVMIDGRSFSGYAQFQSGVVVPTFVAKESGLKHRRYLPSESMVLNVC